jgi:hypothetical protein
MTDHAEGSAEEAGRRRVSTCVLALRWLAGQLAAERHPLAHVPAQVAASLLEEQVGGCRMCGAPLPQPARTGRPRSRCLRCSPSRRKPSAKSTIAA